MRGREFNKRIEIWQSVMIADGYGGHIPQDTFIGKSWAKLTTINGNSSRSLDSVGMSETSQSIRVVCRKREDLPYNSVNLYVKYGGDKYSIISTPIDVDFNHSLIEFIMDKNKTEEVELLTTLDNFVPDTQRTFDFDSIINTSNQVFDLHLEDDRKIVVMNYQGDWSVILPKLGDVPLNWGVKVMHKIEDADMGRLVASNGDDIEGLSEQRLYGKGTMTIRKANVDGFYKWFVDNMNNFDDVQLQGKTRVYEFNNVSEFTIPHNLGFIPVVEVWIDDGDGGYVSANVDIDHDWTTKNSTTINIGSVESGKVIY